MCTHAYPRGLLNAGGGAMETGGLEVRYAGGRVRVPAGRPFVIGRRPDDRITAWLLRRQDPVHR
jgi:hypothetical protein